MKDFHFTSESVSEGHPDKLADQISDAILDALLREDPTSRVACETLTTTGMVVIAGEITTRARIDYADVARRVVKDIGYDDSRKGFDYKTCAVLTSLDRQSPDISMGVDSTGDKEQGAGDQGIMFGYAVNETAEYMPLTIDLSHKLVRELAKYRKSGGGHFLRPDSKSQVTAEYQDGRVTRIDNIVISTQHDEDVTQSQIKEAMIEEVIKRVVPSALIDSKTKYFINPTGRFVVGGPQGDCGLTGRKIIVDTYGGHGAHGGGAFSGKDPSKVDRSAAYALRHVAKNIVAAGLAERCLVQVAYAIGVAQPMSILVNDYGTAKCDPRKLVEAVRALWDLRPAAIVEAYDLLKPKYLQTAAYGHFGRAEPGFTWEALDKVAALQDFIGKRNE